MAKLMKIPMAIELVGIFIVGVGISLEVVMGGAIYLIVITIGSGLVAAGGIIFAKLMRGGN